MASAHNHHSVKPDISDLDLDLLTAVVRIRQAEPLLRDDVGLSARLLSCDVPRLLRHVSPEARAWALAEGFDVAEGLDV